MSEIGLLVGYARVSTEDQNLDLQTDALLKAGVLLDNLHVEKVSGASKNRPALELAIKDLREGDTLVVWRLDRLARSMPILYQRLADIERKHAGFRSLTENFDFTSITGKLVVGNLGIVAEFERNIIAQRTKAGIAALKQRRSAKDWKWGPKVIMTPEKIKLAGDHLNGRNGKTKLSGPKIAAKLGVSTASIYAAWKAAAHGKFIRKQKKD